ncbi:leucine-rich single-pass membrane protein 1 isoform X2 [Anolis carolinensis]|uniref:Leucine rich single-pass membrane protein 1 n=1 Tax=Anolis carolinensis TaxID=28377 RepID=A0A803TUQ1_ANOCA|nr:PREDICTED: leucine-rich single-pass membrane protein 1 isoform X2 [Anolis carolinensis]|eukprot:XP_008109354.1 PREDICTED: leucine-rich single-pass membrane protein 1 isoform X2 [Anolis carolinensis]
MESSSDENDIENSQDQEGKLYVVDSLNNLNEHCMMHSHHPVWEYREDTESPGCLMMQSSLRCQSWFFVTSIITLIVSLALVSFVIILIVHTGDKIDELSRKIVLERKSIGDLVKFNYMVLQHLNQTELMDNIENIITV